MVIGAVVTVETVPASTNACEQSLINKVVGWQQGTDRALVHSEKTHADSSVDVTLGVYDLASNMVVARHTILTPSDGPRDGARRRLRKKRWKEVEKKLVADGFAFQAPSLSIKRGRVQIAALDAPLLIRKAKQIKLTNDEGDEPRYELVVQKGKRRHVLARGVYPALSGGGPDDLQHLVPRIRYVYMAPSVQFFIPVWESMCGTDFRSFRIADVLSALK